MKHAAAPRIAVTGGTPTSTRARFLAGCVAVTLLLPGISLSGHAPEAAAARTRLVRKTVPVQATCLEPDQAGYCPASFFVDVKTTRVLKLAFVPDPSLCAPVDVLFRIREGNTIREVGPLRAAPGKSTGVVNAGPASSRKPGIQVLVRDAPGGACEGFVGEWSGDLKIITSKRVRR